MSSPPDAPAIVARMMAEDAFSQWLGIEVTEVRPGYSRLSMTVRDEMCNGFHMAHGGIAYSLADSALAFAANGHGRIAVSAKTSIAHLEKVLPGDALTAVAKELHKGSRLAHYFIDIKNQRGESVAAFDGTVYLTSKNWNL